MTQRTDRIDELLRQEIGQALERELADPGIGFVTVTDVQTSPDLSHSRVWVSVIGPEERRKQALAGLRRAEPYIRRSLGSKIRIRRIPELEFRLDDSAERGTRVLHVLDELEAGRTPEQAQRALESLPVPVPRLPHEGDTAPEAPAEAAPAPGPRTRKRREGGHAGGRKPSGDSGRRQRHKSSR